jgi:beta-galactosidase/beta-glucuronidase
MSMIFNGLTRQIGSIRQNLIYQKKILIAILSRLDFQGIDTYSSIYLNDSLIATTDNMFIGKTVDIKNFAKQVRINFMSSFIHQLTKELNFTIV